LKQQESEKPTPIKVEGSRVISLNQTNNNLRKKYRVEPEQEKQQEGEQADQDKIVSNINFPHRKPDAGIGRCVQRMKNVSIGILQKWYFL